MHVLLPQTPREICSPLNWFCSKHCPPSWPLQCSCSVWPTGNGKKLSNAKHVACPSCAWLLLSFFPYPVVHPEHEHSILGCSHFLLPPRKKEGKQQELKMGERESPKGNETQGHSNWTICSLLNKFCFKQNPSFLTSTVRVDSLPHRKWREF